MLVARISSNGQITIPKVVRDRLRLKAGDRVAFIVQDESTALIVPVRSGLDDLEGILAPPKKRLGLKVMSRAIRERHGRR